MKNKKNFININKSINLLISGYDNKIYLYLLTTERELIYKNSFDCLSNPSWLIKKNNLIFAVNEEYIGNIQSFQLDAANLNLQFINSVPSYGGSPCYIFNNDNNLLIANYTSGVMSVIPYTSNGILDDPIQTIIQEPIESSNIHCNIFYKNIVTIANLGLNTITQYFVNDNVINQEYFNIIQFPNNSGPRHIKVDPLGNFIIVICELYNTLTILPINQDGIIDNIEFHNYFTISSLPVNQNPENMYAAEIQFLNSGDYVYASNRDLSTNGKNSSITVYKIIRCNNIILELIQEIYVGQYPRYFTFLDDENIIAIVNQIDGNFVSYLIDKNTGFIKIDSKISTDNNFLLNPAFILPI